MTEDQIAEQKANITTYTKLLNTTILTGDADLLGFVVDEMLDRIRLYLNREDVPVIVERPLAKVVSSIFNKYKTTAGSTEPDHHVLLMEDNGQRVSYENAVKSYLTSASDDELFTTIEPLLKRYRRLNIAKNPPSPQDSSGWFGYSGYL